MTTELESQYVLESWRNALRVLQGMDAHERANHFNMMEWGYKTACGSVCCIAGHCSLDPWFNENRQIVGTWNGRSLVVDYPEFPRVFGDGWGAIFMDQSIADHADAVRSVLRKLAELGDPASPFGFGMPAFLPALDVSEKNRG